MTSQLRCDAVTDSIEALAAGEPVGPFVPAAHAEHVEGCETCQRRVETARRLDVLLLQAVALGPPDGFTRRLAWRLQRERRSRERLVDFAFNAAVSTSGVAVLAAIWVAFQWTGLNRVALSVTSLLGQGLATAVAGVGGEAFLYVAGTLASVTALLVWRWSEGEHFL